MIRICFTNRQRLRPIGYSKITRVLKSILKHACPPKFTSGGRRRAGYRDCSLSVVLVGNAEIRRINHRFLRRNAVTDVISFPLSDKGDTLLGEIIVSVEEAIHQAKRRQIPLSDEILLYCVHGSLHLLGYDDTTPAARKRMWRKQDEILSHI